MQDPKNLMEAISERSQQKEESARPRRLDLINQGELNSVRDAIGQVLDDFELPVAQQE